MVPHRRIEATLGERIRSGEYRHGARLPSVRELATGFAVNTRTVLKAISHLETSGLVRRQARTGIFVQHAPGTGAATSGTARDACLGFPLFAVGARVALSCCVTDYAQCHQRLWRRLRDRFHSLHPRVELRIDSHRVRPDWQQIQERYDLFSIYDWQLPHIPLGLTKRVPETLRAEATQMADPHTREALGRLQHDGVLAGVPYCRFVPVLLGHTDLLPKQLVARFSSVCTWRELLGEATRHCAARGAVPVFLLEPFSLGLLVRNIEQLRVAVGIDETAFRSELTSVLSAMMEYVRTCPVQQPCPASADVEARFFDRQVAALIGGVAVLTACYDRQVDLNGLVIGFPPLLRDDLSYPSSMVSMAVNANSQVPDAAEAFQRFLISPDAQTIIAEARIQLPWSAQATASDAFLAPPPVSRRVLPGIMRRSHYSFQGPSPFAPGVMLGGASEALVRLLEGDTTPSETAAELWAALRPEEGTP